MVACVLTRTVEWKRRAFNACRGRIIRCGIEVEYEQIWPL